MVVIISCRSRIEIQPDDRGYVLSAPMKLTNETITINLRIPLIEESSTALAFLPQMSSSQRSTTSILEDISRTQTHMKKDRHLLMKVVIVTHE